MQVNKCRKTWESPFSASRHLDVSDTLLGTSREGFEEIGPKNDVTDPEKAPISQEKARSCRVDFIPVFLENVVEQGWIG